MAVLKNPRYEMFAQELAQGKSAVEAYTLAGFKGHRQNAHRLITNDDIQYRVAEIQQASAVRAEITVAGLTEDLLRIARKGEDLAEASGLSVARGAIMDAAKLNGLLIERTENFNVHHDVSDEPLTEEQWAAEHPTNH